MGQKIHSERQEAQIEYSRSLVVSKRNDMIQKGRQKLSLVEQKIVLFAISQLKPEDTEFKDLTINLNHFNEVCGYQRDTYTRTKETLKKLADKSWFIRSDDGKKEILVRWFSKLEINLHSGLVTLKFHEQMEPYLLQLKKQQAENKEHYTCFEFQYTLPMSSQYSPLLYELLKSYQVNNNKWYFDIEDLKYHLGCQKYTRFPDFRRYVLEPAVEDINNYSDIEIAWDKECEGRKVVRIKFYMVKKNRTSLIKTQLNIKEELDGDYTPIMMDKLYNSVEAQFFEKKRQEGYVFDEDYIVV